jgi:CheY-like chemotaxis protein
VETNKPVTCFIIDDDTEDQEIFAIAVEEINSRIKCVSAIDGVEALQKLRDFTPDFIFLDLNMPRMGGKETLREIRKIPALLRVPVIAYSTSSEPRDIEDMKKLGADHFITKPPDITSLIDKVREALSLDFRNYENQR